MDDQKFEQWMKEQRQELRKRLYQRRRRSLLGIGIGLMIFAGLALLRYVWW